MLFDDLKIFVDIQASVKEHQRFVVIVEIPKHKRKNDSNKCISIDVKPSHLPSPNGADLFRLLTNCFLLFCSVMAGLIFPTL